MPGGQRFGCCRLEGRTVPGAQLNVATDRGSRDLDRGPFLLKKEGVFFGWLLPQDNPT